MGIFAAVLIAGASVDGPDLTVGTFAGRVNRYRHRSRSLVNDASNRAASGLLRPGLEPEDALLERHLVERKNFIGVVLASEVHSALGFIPLLVGRRGFHCGAG